MIPGLKINKICIKRKGGHKIMLSTDVGLYEIVDSGKVVSSTHDKEWADRMFKALLIRDQVSRWATTA